MSSFDLISMAIRNLWKRKLRTFLTVLGVVIGTASIIVMVSLGIGMSESFEDQISQWGDIKAIQINKSSQNNSKVILDDKAINRFMSIEGVETATPIIEMNLKFLVGKNVANINVRGLNPASMEALGYNVSEGRLLHEGDTLSIVFGSEVSRRFYNPKTSSRNRRRNSSTKPTVDLMKDKIQMSYDRSFGEKKSVKLPTENINKTPTKAVEPYKVTAVGILESSDNYEVSNCSYMPIEQVKKLKKEQEKFEKSQYGGASGQANTQTGYDTAIVKCIDIEHVQQIQQQLKDMGYEAYSLSDELTAMKNTSASLQGLLGAIGAVSLFVAAIGITNTMVMSIYERTREIGVMKVIGAALKDIKRLFLVEAALIGFIGGLFGVAVSLLISMLLNSSGMQLLGGMLGMGGTSKLSSIPAWLCLASLIFSALVGILSGYFPAKRAMNLSAISAIRTE
jgi:ABC-type antimicrobial peptide transport system permease subunit